MPEYECVKCGVLIEQEGVPIPNTNGILGYARYCEDCQHGQKTMSKLTPFLRSGPFKRAITFPAALALWPLVSRNYHLRKIGAKPDEWYWADEWLLFLGWVVVDRNPKRNKKKHEP